MSESRIAPRDWKDPKWNDAGKVHEWKNYASPWLREVWQSIPHEARKAVAASLDDAASREEWD